jgi:thiamine transport system substrate-binding protein
MCEIATPYEVAFYLLSSCCPYSFLGGIPMQHTPKFTVKIVLLLFVTLSIAAVTSAQSDEDVLTIVTHDSFSISEDVLIAFEEQTGATVRILRSGDAGSMVNQAVLSRDNPLGDLMYGVDNTFLSRALDADVFIPYESPMLASISKDFLLDDLYRVTPINFGDVCLNYDVNFFEVNDLAVPDSFESLADETYRDLLVVENPATSSPGLAFLLATIDYFGAPELEETESTYTYLDYWQDLVANGVLVVEDWTDAYYGEFTVAGGGTRPLVVSYASSPPAEVFFAEEPFDEAPTGSVTATGMCFRQIEFAGILDGTENEALAREFVDFMLTLEFQEDLPLQMFVFPVNAEAALPEVFEMYAAIPEEPVYMPIDTIDTYREDWILAWTETVLR